MKLTVGGMEYKVFNMEKGIKRTMLTSLPHLA